jgi:hypothetical protein
MIPKKPAPDLIRGGSRFSEKIMRKKSWTMMVWRNAQTPRIRPVKAALTIRNGFHGSPSFRGAAQGLIKVDGTFV